MKEEIVLSIEAAVGGGSVAVTRGETVLGTWHSREAISRSEELLMRIAELFDRLEMGRGSLDRVAVSNGPGSYTGIRVGVATAMGLARALDIPCTGVSLLKAIAMTSDGPGDRIVALPLGRSGYCWQHFNESGTADPRSVPETGGLEKLIGSAAFGSAAAVFLQSDVFAAIDSPNEHFIDIGRDLAVRVGLASAFLDDGLVPFYAADPKLGASA